MTTIERSILAAVLAALAIGARAAPPVTSTCITPDGRAIYSDSADECKNAAVRKLNPDGSPKGLIPAPLTQQGQQSAKDESDRKEAECKAQKEQYQKGVALLERFPSEDDLQDARYRALGDQLKQVNLANDRLKKLFVKGRDLSEKAKFFEPPHQMPEDLRRDRDLNRKFEQLEFLSIAGAAHEIQSINDRFDADLKRYREAVDGAAKMPCDAKNEHEPAVR
jgi:hypothetical protein